MNTEQNYVGRASHANPARKPAEKAAMATACNGSQEDHQHLYQELHQTIGRFIDQDATYFVGILEGLFQGWSLYHFGEESPESKPHIRVSKQLMDDAVGAVELMAHIARIGENWLRIKQAEKLAKLSRK